MHGSHYPYLYTLWYQLIFFTDSSKEIIIGKLCIQYPVRLKRFTGDLKTNKHGTVRFDPNVKQSQISK